MRAFARSSLTPSLVAFLAANGPKSGGFVDTNLHDWLPDEHLAWFVLEAVEELDLEPCHASYRADG